MSNEIKLLSIYEFDISENPENELTICMLGNISLFFVVCWLFSKLTFSKIYFWDTIRVSNSLDPDKVRRFVGHDLGPIRL